MSSERIESRRLAGELLEASFACAPIGVALIGFDGLIIRANDALCALIGRQELDLIGTTAVPLTHHEDQEMTEAHYTELRAGGGPVAFEKRYLRPDGEAVWTSTRAAAVLGPDGQPSHIVAQVIDIGELRVAEALRAQATQLFENAFANAPIGMALVSLDGRWLKVNESLCELLGYPEAELLMLTFQEITHADDLDADMRQVERLVAEEIDRYTMSKRYFRKDGDEVWANLSVSLVRDEEGQPAHFIAQIEDISKRKRLERALQHLADHDHLTELWNRRAFEHQLRRQIAQCRRSGAPAALLIVDLDGFKRVNDTHGHAAGDELLMRVTRCLRRRLRTSDCIARIGGDEFAVLLPDTSPVQAARVAASVTDEIGRACIMVGEDEVRVAASVGVTPIDEHSSTEREVLAAGDRAMYEVKVRSQDPP
jgi:diguanylate cyclase (GGDEF)-like protein/PAS domain S-box-containing protein